MSAVDFDDQVGHGAPAGGSAAGGDLPGDGDDVGSGDKAAVVPTASRGTILLGGLSDGFLGSSTGLDGRAVPVVGAGDALARTGQMTMGQLTLISLLLGLGIATLRMRRHRIVV